MINYLYLRVTFKECWSLHHAIQHHVHLNPVPLGLLSSLVASQQSAEVQVSLVLVPENRGSSQKNALFFLKLMSTVTSPTTSVPSRRAYERSRTLCT